MFYTEKERQEFWKADQIGFAEKAHEYPCCDIPTLKMCYKCDDKKLKFCKNKIDLRELLKTLKFVKNV